MRKPVYLGVAAGLGIAFALSTAPCARAAVVALDTCQIDAPAAEGPCHPTLGFAVDVPVTVSAGGADLPLTMSLHMHMGADVSLSYDPGTFLPGGTTGLALTYTPTDDFGPEFTLNIDSQAGTISADGHTLSVPASHLISAAMDFPAPLDGDAPVSSPLVGDSMTVCLETDIGCIDVIDVSLSGTLTLSAQPAPCLPGLNMLLGGAAALLCGPLGPPCSKITVESPSLGLLDWNAAGETLPATVQLANPIPVDSAIGAVLTPLVHWVHADATVDATISGSGIFSFIGDTTVPLIGRGGKIAENLGDALTSLGLVDAIANAAGSIGPLIKPVVAMGNLPVPLLNPEVPHITNTQNLTLNLGAIAFTLQRGLCAGVTCTAKDSCHDAGTCDPATGQCSNPPKMRAAIEAACQAQGMGCTNARDHREYVRCVTRQSKAAVDNGTLPRECRDSLLKCAKQSTCSRKPGSVTCCRTTAKGKTTCDIKSSAADCKPPRGGHACAGSVPSCCDACTAAGCATTTTTTTTVPPTTIPPSGGLQCACEASSDCRSEAPCCCQGLAGGNVCTLQQDCAAGGGTCECNAGDVQLFGGVCPGTPCSVDQQCSFVEFCTGGVCTLKQPKDGACAFSSGCLDGCCCSVGASNATCDLQSECANHGGTCECSAGDVHLFGGVCPGAPCSVDSQCSRIEFCTGGACTLKQPTGGECAFSSGCVDSCCCSVPGGPDICSTQTSCAASGGTCQCAPGDAGLFGGVCPGTPCGQDSQCSSIEFCTDGACTLKQPDGGPCAFSSGCTNSCCCSVAGEENACSGQIACVDRGGTCQCAPGDAHLFGGVCPGTPCGQDNQCSSIEFCTGGVCTLRQPAGGPCAFSSGCSDACCCTPAGGGSPTCSLQGACAEDGGSCECSGGDAHLFGGICPGHPCGQDNQCSSIEFCTGGACTLKLPGGGPCSFSSGCLDGCCCAGTCTFPGSCGEACLP